VTSIQLKLLWVLAALVAVTVAGLAWTAEHGLRARELERIESSLLARSELVREQVGTTPLVRAHTPELDAVARRAAAAARARVTLIAADGSVVADSDVPPDAVPEVENHAGRPEIQAALAGRVGVSSRRSATVLRDLLYLAVPMPEGGATRLAMDLTEVDAAVADLRRKLAVASAVAMAGALLLALAISAYTVRPLRSILGTLQEMAGGNLEGRVPVRSNDELGRIGRALNSMADQLRDRLTQITAEKDRLDAVLESMVDGVLVLDTQGRVSLANPRARELLEIYGPVEGRSLLEVVRNPQIDQSLHAAAEATAPVVSEVEIRAPGRAPRTLLLHAVTFPADGPPMGTVAVFHDLTDLRRLENVRRDFVANASHELQTPLTAIRGFAETLLASPIEPSEARSQLDVILRNAERLAELIRDMMELSRIESRRAPLQPGELDLERLTRMVLRDMEPRMKERALDVTLHGEKAAPAWADRRAVEQVLTNLLDNAAKYTDPGGSVRVEIARRSGGVRVSVGDTGIGIPGEHLGRIFERFYRVDKARSRALGGTGLGLAIVKHLVQAMGGEIFVESEPGRGTTFHFTLPGSDPRSV
jgi:two-component system phosphate regulon sensor histidine kinase PhoR